MKETEPEAVLPPLSQSKQGLLACPASYTTQVIKGQKGPDSAASIRGTAVHRFLSDYTKNLCIFGKTQDRDLWDLWQAEEAPDVREILEPLRDKFKIDPEAVFATEHHLALDVNFRPLDTINQTCAPQLIAYEGTLDLITIDETGRRAQIDDYKSNFRAFEADTFQGQLYALLLFQSNPQLAVITFRLWFVRWNRDRQVSFTREQIPELQAEARKWRAYQISLHVNEAGNGVPLALPGSHCLYCPLLANGCPIEKNPYGDAPGQLRNAIYFKQALAKAEQYARDYADLYGPLKVTDGLGTEYSGEWALRDERHISLDGLPAILDWQRKKKDFILPKLRISGLTSLLKAKKRAELAETLANFTEMIPQSRFRIGKVKEMEEDDGPNGE